MGSSVFFYPTWLLDVVPILRMHKMLPESLNYHNLDEQTGD